MAEPVLLRPFALPAPSVRRLDNGLCVLALQRPGAPVACACLVLAAGSARDPQGKAGLADLTVELLRRGTEALPATAIDEAVELMGLDLRLETSRDSSWMTGTMPAEHLEPSLRLMAELVHRPLFESREVARAKERRVAQRRNDLDDPGTVASDALLRVAAPRHPYGRPGAGIGSQVARLRRSDVIAYYRTWFRPDRGFLVLVSSLAAPAAHALAARCFGGWRLARARAAEPLPPLTLPPGNSLLLVHRPGATQAQVRLACAGPARQDPEIIASRVAGTVFGGAFASRLVQAARVERGLTYGIGCFQTEDEAGGLFGVASSTRTESARELIDVVLDEARRFREEGASADELARAQRYLTGQFPLHLETVDQLARAMADVARNGRELDWLLRYRERVMAVGLEDVLRQARRLAFPGPLAMAVVGDARRLSPALQGLGRLRRVSVEFLA